MDVVSFFRDYPLLILLAAPVIWFGMQAGLSFLVRPYRAKLRDGLTYLKRHSRLKASEVEYLDHLWLTAFAPRSAILLTIVYIQGLLMRRDAIMRERDEIASHNPHFWSDPRIHDMMDWYFASIVVANPLFGVSAMILRLMWRIKLILLLRTTRDDRNLVSMPPFETAAKV